MKTSSKYRLIAAAAFLILIGGLSIFVLRQRFGSITVHNETSSMLTGISVSDGDGPEWFPAAPVGKTSKRWMLITTNGPLVLDVRSLGGSWTLKPNVRLWEGLEMDVTVRADGSISVVGR